MKISAQFLLDLDNSRTLQDYLDAVKRHYVTEDCELGLLARFSIKQGLVKGIQICKPSERERSQDC